MPPAGGDSEGLEGYHVETPDGAPAGRVTALLLLDGRELIVGVAPGKTLFRRRLHALPWAAVEGVDHARAAIRVSPEALESAPTLDPRLRVATDEARALPYRVLPLGLPPAMGGSRVMSVRSDRIFVPVALVALASVALLGVIAFLATPGVCRSPRR